MKKSLKYIKRVAFYSATAVLLFSCEDFIEVDPPITDLVGDTVFEEDINAEAALIGLYNRLGTDEVPLFTNVQSIPLLAGLSSDELLNFSPFPDIVDFSNNDLQEDNGFNTSRWALLYESIYRANSIIEGLTDSETLTESLATQWEGEARFIRAFCFFYLVNLYGDVPLAISTDFQVNSFLPRSETNLVYDQIIEDLLEAQNLLGEDYPTDQRVRVNNAAADALLARVYLYLENWEAAEREASKVIDNSRYSLETNLDNVFLNTSNEAIWQFDATLPLFGSREGAVYISTGRPRFASLRPEYLSTFEDGDIRESSWVGTSSSGSETFFFPFKFKVTIDFSGAVPNENLTPLRLAEMYLVRAEARARLNNISGAQEDINAVRSRAQLGPTTASDQNTLILAIELERKHEFFAEFGHRWFDLKRYGRATELIAPSKPSWQPTDVLWPVPLGEFLNNPNLGEQNPGY